MSRRKNKLLTLSLLVTGSGLLLSQRMAVTDSACGSGLTEGVGRCSSAVPRYHNYGAFVSAGVDGSDVNPGEQSVIILPLAGDLLSKCGKESAEVSGLAWYRDHLIILPQYPRRFSSNDDGVIFAIAKKRILAFLDGRSTARIAPQRFTFVAHGVDERIAGFQGYEAIAFLGQRVFMTIEATPDVSNQDGRMRAYIVSGTIDGELREVRLDPSTLTSIPVQTSIKNMAEEALLIVDDTVITIHEANGRNVNHRPLAHVFDLALRSTQAIAFPTIEYRITDASAPDAARRFWCINYLFPGDMGHLLPAPDALMSAHRAGSTHARRPGTERLVEFQYAHSGIEMTDTAPIQLQLADDAHSRNWEGLVRLDDRGFLMMTDRHPHTVLAFVPSP